ncbi:pentapeptide repeat-containing protein [Staphylococcus xylosus]|uniref:pentapeptide repeat-containing protein n=1 Tax=Staphylococcus xylosus TaxID=1288 RepID=UPI003F551CD6
MKIHPPKINAHLEKKELTDVFDEVDDLIELAEISNSSLEEKALDRLLIYGSTIKDCCFANSDLGRADFTDVVFENCDFSNSMMAYGTIHRVTFKNCRMTGTLFKNMRLSHITFEEVKANFINLIESKNRCI